MGWILWIGIGIALIILIRIIRKIRKKNKNEDDVWDQARKTKRGACGKIKDFLWGC